MRKKDRKPIKQTERRISRQDMTAIRRMGRDSQVAALREGRKNRAVTFVDRKKEANRSVCRGRVRY